MFQKLSQNTRQWLWFVGLWFAGVFVVGSIAYLIKFLMLGLPGWA